MFWYIFSIQCENKLTDYVDICEIDELAKTLADQLSKSLAAGSKNTDILFEDDFVYKSISVSYVIFFHQNWSLLTFIKAP